MDRPHFALFIHRTVSALLIASFLVTLWENQWSSAFYIACIFFLIHLPTLLKNYFSVYIPIELDAAIGVFTFLSLFLGALHNFYSRYPIWDSLLHFQSGLLLSIGGFVLIYIINGRDNKRLRLTPAFISFASFNFSLAMSVIWEIYEFFVDSRFGYNMQNSGNPDTMKDLILNTIGALIIASTAYVWMKYTSKFPLTEKKVDA